MRSWPLSPMLKTEIQAKVRKKMLDICIGLDFVVLENRTRFHKFI